jgi:DNA-binding NarL/FixJ family response regulator
MRVLLVDDHAPIRRGIRQLLELKTDYEIVG